MDPAAADKNAIVDAKKEKKGIIPKMDKLGTELEFDPIQKVLHPHNCYLFYFGLDSQIR